MVSFRNNQFRALLWGLLVADAASHGQFAVRGAILRTQPQQGGALESDRWCHQIAEQLSHPAVLARSAVDVAARVAAASSLAELLALLPQALLAIEALETGWVRTATVVSLDDSSVGMLFYQALMALWNDDLPRLIAIHDRVNAIAQTTNLPLAQMLSLALQQVFLANWDFNLVLSQSLQTQSPLEGLPVLTGILSAGKVGMAGLPVAKCQALGVPEAVTQAWLQQRWSLTTAWGLESWTQTWWQQWLGSHSAPPLSVVGVAVCPAPASG